MTAHKNIFATVLTYAAPSSNYRGESEENRTVLQKITHSHAEWTVISPESMRNALREQLAQRGLKCNRRRLHNEEQLAVEYESYPDATKYADDFLFGFMVADNNAIKKNKDKPSKRDSVLRMNMAVSLVPYRFDATFHQSPLSATEDKKKDPPFKNSTSSALVHREVAHTAYQYPFALAGSDCKQNVPWCRSLLEAIGELSNVAGGHARSYYEMAPRSVVARVTNRLVAGFNTYGFAADGSFAELSRVLSGEDLPGEEFFVGGEVVRNMSAEEREKYRAKGVKLFENPERLLAAVADAAWGAKG